MLLLNNLFHFTFCAIISRALPGKYFQNQSSRRCINAHPAPSFIGFTDEEALFYKMLKRHMKYIFLALCKRAVVINHIFAIILIYRQTVSLM